MKCDVLTLFPDILNAYLNESILKRAKEKKLLDVKLHNIRDFTLDPHRKVDDYPYGGGAGMVFKPEPIFRALADTGFHIERESNFESTIRDTAFG